MSTMVERVARAMCEAADDNWDWSVFYIVDANDTAETGRDVYRDMARAAIEAMMEPTEAMLDAVADEGDKRGIPNSVIDALIAEEAWPLMIQAALKEQA